MSKRALVIGINGFVGPYLADELLANGYEVVGCGVERQSALEPLSEYLVCDITNYEQIRNVIKRLRPDFVINLAAISSVGLSWKIPKTVFDINAGGTLNLLEAIRELGFQERTRILIVGSSEEYEPSDKPLNENDTLDASSPYGISKANQERIAELYGLFFGIQIVRTRSFNHTGVGQPESFVLPSFCKQVAAIANGSQEPVISVGNLEVRRDFSDVRDVVRAYRLLLENEACIGEAYNVGSGKAYQLNELLATIIDLSGLNIDIRVDPERFRPQDNPFIQADICKITQATGWQPVHGIAETLGDMLRYFCGNELLSS